jgi:hypothetical protein
VRSKFGAVVIFERLEMCQNAPWNYFCRKTATVARNLLQKMTNFELIHMLCFPLDYLGMLLGGGDEKGH